MRTTKELNKKEKCKGITLIALIITIIVMLILVSVTISMAVNGGLFEKAGDAVGDTQNAINAEQVLADGRIEIDGKWYDSIDEYLSKDDWRIIYEGKATTNNGQVILSNTNLFKSGYRYRITVESDEYTGTIETVAIYANSENGIRQYALFVIKEGQAIPINSRQDFEEKLSAADSKTTGVAAFFGKEIGNGIMFVNSSCDYTITKIEENMYIEGTKLFEGEHKVEIIGEGVEIPEFTADLTKEYGIVFSYDGEIMYETTTTTNINTALVCNTSINVMLYGNMAFYFAYEEHEIIIYEIYEIGNVTNYVEENGFGVFYSNDEWGLWFTPNTSYVVPTTVGNITVDKVYMDCISGEPIFDKAYELKTTGDPWSINKIKVVTTDYSFIFDEFAYELLELDLSECGDNVEIPDEYLSYNITIYVSSAVKAKYADYDNVVSK